MLQPARTDEDIARFQPEKAPTEQRNAWERMKNEPARWFLRFQIYRNLGAKRSLRATIATEAEAQPATKGNRKLRATQEKLSDVSVPGSWSRAAKMWQWKERAAAWDSHQMQRYAQHLQKQVGNCIYASRAYRIIALNTFIQALENTFKKLETFQEQMACMRQIQSLLKDITDQTTLFDGLDTTELDGLVVQWLNEHHSKQ